MADLSSIYNKVKESVKQATSVLTSSNTKLEDKATNISSISADEEVTVLRFPLEMDDSQKYKTLKLCVLKQQTWEQIQKLANSMVDSIMGSNISISDNFQGISNALTNSSGAVNTAVGLGVGAYNGAIGTTSDVLDVIKNGFKGAMTDLANVSKYSKESFETIIQLPIPNNLLESENHNYTGGKFDDSELVSGLTKTYGETEKLINSALQSGSQMAAFENRRTAAPMPQMPVLNPFLFQKYEGSEMKEYGFVFFLVPRTQQEAEQCMRISYLLKKFSYPSKATISQIGTEEQNNKGKSISTGFMVPPNKVLLKFDNPMLQKLINPGVCVIKSVQTTYNEGTTVGLTIDGVPRFIEINMTLCEYNQKFQEDF